MKSVDPTEMIVFQTKVLESLLKLQVVNSPCILDNIFFIVIKVSVILCKLLMTSGFLLSFTELIKSTIA